MENLTTELLALPTTDGVSEIPMSQSSAAAVDEELLPSDHAASETGSSSSCDDTGNVVLDATHRHVTFSTS